MSKNKKNKLSKKNLLAKTNTVSLKTEKSLSKQYLITRAKDQNKDQSYFLWQIEKNKLSKILFPIGEFTSKKQVREYAEARDLVTARKKDSQGLCFIGQTSLSEMLKQILGSKTGLILQVKDWSSQEIDFLEKLAILQKNNKNSKVFKNLQIPLGLENFFKEYKARKIWNLSQTQINNLDQKQIKINKGDLLQIGDKNYSYYPVLGWHQGAFLYTIGQRHNLGLSNGPWFVQKIDIENNLLFVVHQNFQAKLASSDLVINNLNWQVDLKNYFLSKWLKKIQEFLDLKNN